MRLGYTAILKPTSRMEFRLTSALPADRTTSIQ